MIDQQGAVLPGVAIVVRDQDSGRFRETVSNADGTYFVAAIRPGRYEITAELEGFKAFSRRDLVIEVGKTLTVDVRMEVGTVQEAVTVTAEAPLVDTASKEVGGNITSRELVDLPSINRNFIGFVGLLPGIVPNISTESFGSDSVNVNGQDARNNNYLLDGANNNDDVIGQRAGTQARTPIESIQEFQVITNQFDAEFGRTTGAVINAVTKQGTNQFRGSAFGFFQDASLTKPDYFVKENNLSKPKTKQRQWGGTIGGPIVRDKAHFFFSLERVAIDRASTINIPARPELDASPTTQDRVWNTLIRFDHQINANHTWGVRWLREQSPQKNQIIGAVTLAAAREESDVDQTHGRDPQLGVRQQPGEHAAGGVHPRERGLRQPGLQRQRPPAGRAAADADLPDLHRPAEQRGAGAHQQRLPARGHLLLVRARQAGRPRRQGRRSSTSSRPTTSRDQGNRNGTFTFGTNGPFDANDPAAYPERLSIRVPGNNAYFMKAHFMSAFAQDKWRMNDKLTVSLGARYDLEVIPLKELDNPEFSDAGKYPVDKNNLAPRIGFSYDLNGDGRSVIRGGYGLFFDKTHFELITAIISAGVYSVVVHGPLPGQRGGPGALERPAADGPDAGGRSDGQP